MVFQVDFLNSMHIHVEASIDSRAIFPILEAVLFDELYDDDADHCVTQRLS